MDRYIGIHLRQDLMVYNYSLRIRSSIYLPDKKFIENISNNKKNVDFWGIKIDHYFYNRFN